MLVGRSTWRLLLNLLQAGCGYTIELWKAHIIFHMVEACDTTITIPIIPVQYYNSYNNICIVWQSHVPHVPTTQTIFVLYIWQSHVPHVPTTQNKTVIGYSFMV